MRDPFPLRGPSAPFKSQQLQASPLRPHQHLDCLLDNSQRASVCFLGFLSNPVGPWGIPELANRLLAGRGTLGSDLLGAERNLGWLTLALKLLINPLRISFAQQASCHHMSIHDLPPIYAWFLLLSIPAFLLLYNLIIKMPSTFEMLQWLLGLYVVFPKLIFVVRYLLKLARIKERRSLL